MPKWCLAPFIIAVVLIVVTSVGITRANFVEDGVEGAEKNTIISNLENFRAEVEKTNQRPSYKRKKWERKKGK